MLIFNDESNFTLSSDDESESSLSFVSNGSGCCIYSSLLVSGNSHFLACSSLIRLFISTSCADIKCTFFGCIFECSSFLDDYYSDISIC